MTNVRGIVVIVIVWFTVKLEFEMLSFMKMDCGVVAEQTNRQNIGHT